MGDSGYRAFHDDCGGLVAFGIAGDGFCTRCEDENVSFGDYTLTAVQPPEPGPGLVCPGCGSRDVDVRRGLLCGTCAETAAEEGGEGDG